MWPLRRMITAAVLLSVAAIGSMSAAGSFDQKLSPEKQIIHALNRLTFGPRPGDVQQVQRIGLQAWINQQLNPQQIAENPALDSKLKTLETLALQPGEIAEKYSQTQTPFGPLMPMSTPSMNSPEIRQQLPRLMNGSAEERRSILLNLDPALRRDFLATAPAQIIEGLSEFQEEAAKARQVRQEEMQREMRRLRPPLTDLLTPEQMRVVRTGTRDQKLNVINSFEGEKRLQVIRAIGPQQLIELPELRRQALIETQPQLFVNEELIANKLYRAIYSNRQLEEVLTDFWLNHFNVYNGKGPGRILLTSYERDAIRPHILGRFKDLLLATARHPAMLFYLDNWQSQSPPDPPANLAAINAIAPNIRRPGLNENYARELMELHTLGVDGGYTQADIVAVARAFAGWTIFEPNRWAEFQFNPQFHDRKQIAVLGRNLPAGRGEQDGLDVIDILAKHPSTAKFISKKLAQRFVADEPPQALIDRMAATFTTTDGDLRAVLQTMFTSTEFLSEGAWQAKLKSPLEMTVSALRVLNADVADTFALAQRIAELGQPLYGKVEPTGYPNTAEAWTNTASILGRINLASALTQGEISGVKADLSRFNYKEPAFVAAQLLSMTPSAALVASVEKGVQGKEATPSLLASLILSSPDFQRR